MSLSLRSPSSVVLSSIFTTPRRIELSGACEVHFARYHCAAAFAAVSDISDVSHPLAVRSRWKVELILPAFIIHISLLLWSIVL